MDAKSVSCTKCPESAKHVFRSTSTMARHLKHIHEIEPESETNTAQNLTLNTYAKFDNLSFDESVNRKFALAIGTSSAPNSFIENDHFVSAIKLLKPDFQLLKRKQVSNVISKESQQILLTIKDNVEKASSVSICADFWSLKTFGFLKITIHYYADGQMNTNTICLKKVPHPHTAEVVMAETNLALSMFDLCVDDPKLSHIITDNGSNMKAAFKKTKGSLIDSGEIDIDSNDDVELCSDFDLEKTEVPKRLHCVDHALANNLKRSVKSTDPISSLVKKAIDIAKKLKYNALASQQLLAKTGKTVLLPPSTRWNYLTEFFTRFLQLKIDIKIICEQNLQIDFLTFNEVESAADFLEILDEYSKLINFFQTTKGPTLSYVVVGLLELKLNLHEWADIKSESVKQFCLNALMDFETRFAFALNTESSNFILTYSVASYLDPRYFKYFETEDFSYLKKAVLSFLDKVVVKPSNILEPAPKSNKKLDKKLPTQNKNQLTRYL